MKRAAVVFAALLFACARESPGPVEADPADIACAEECGDQGGMFTGAMCENCDGSRMCHCWEGDESGKDIVCANLRAWQGCGEWRR